MTKILYVINNLGVGGAENVLLGLAGGLDRSRYEPVVVCVGRNHAMVSKFAEADVPIRCLNAAFQADPRGYTRLLEIAREERPNVIHGFMWRANMLARYVGQQLNGTRVVTSEHSMHFDGPLRAWANRRTAGMSAAVVCVSKAVMRHMRDRVGLPERLLRVIYNGVDISRFVPVEETDSIREHLGLPTDRPIVGTVARHTEEKRLERFVQAAEAIAHECPDAVFVTCGDGPTLPTIRAMADQRSVDLRLLGRRDDVPSVLAALDIFTLTSAKEGLPVAVIEAMAVERPIVSMVVGGVTEIMRDGVDGVLVPQGDVDGLVAGVIRLLRDKELRVRMGKSARERAISRVSLEAMVKAHEDLYDELVACAGS